MSEPRLSLIYGFVPAVTGWLASAMLIWFDVPYLVLPFSAGFFFVGPFIAVGLYDVSRRRESGNGINAQSTFGAWRRNPEQIALMGLLFLLLHLAWMRVAQLLFAFFAWRDLPSWDRFADVIWYASHNLPFLTLGVICGAVLAAIAFVIGAFSIPYLLDRPDSNLFEAIGTSAAAVRVNLRPMLLWAGLIVFLIALGMVTGLIGLVVTLPITGYATWHAYRDVVCFDGSSR
ncbi:DUF2189 domain-containing protein [Enhydrobacter aerosaccus]|nr:DUF2189 domain-containing protein [Enhydrobacter aerosaccus]